MAGRRFLGTLLCVGIVGMVGAFFAGCDTDRGGELLAPLLFSSPDDSTGERYGEPNDTIQEATDIPTNNIAVASALYSARDVDYFRFTAAKGAQYIIRTSDVEPGVRMRIAVHTAEDQEIVSSVGGALQTGTAEIRWTAPKAGYYYVRVSSAGGGGGTYKLRISVGKDSFEPDNAISQARTINVNGEAQQRTLHDRNDVDYIAFIGLTGFAYRIAVEATDTTENFAVSVVDGAGTILATNEAPPYGLLTVTAPMNGLFFVRVAAKNDRALGTYTVRATPASDPWEPDSTIALAKHIETDGTPQRHSFSSASDQDYLAFEAEAGHVYTIRTDSLTNGVDTQIELNSATGTALVSDDDGGGGKASELRWLAPATATFYVIIRSAAGGEPGTYIVAVRRDQVGI